MWVDLRFVGVLAAGRCVARLDPIERVDDDAVRRARTAYYALVYRLDTMIGELLRCLADEGLDENTLVVYTTDHGDQLGERGLWWKHTLYEESVRVPLIVRWPGRASAC